MYLFVLVHLHCRILPPAPSFTLQVTWHGSVQTMAELPVTEEREFLPQSGHSRKSSAASVGADESRSNSRRSSKRLSRQASMERHSLDEQESRRTRKYEKRRSCPDYFGVKSYLHNFYDTAFFKDPSIYEEEDDYRYLLNPARRRRRCRPVWWKVSTWIGVNLMIFGVVGILVGYLVPRKPIIIETDSTNQILLVDKQANPHNTMLDMCKIIGLVLFCLGGTTLALALLFPSFLHQYCSEERYDDGIRVRYGEDSKPPPLSPIEMTIPASSKVSSVQPERNGTESLLTKDGMVNVKE